VHCTKKTGLLGGDRHVVKGWDGPMHFRTSPAPHTPASWLFGIATPKSKVPNISYLLKENKSGL
jgi:hypothetical protein